MIILERPLGPEDYLPFDRKNVRGSADDKSTVAQSCQHGLICSFVRSFVRDAFSVCLAKEAAS